MGFLDDMIEAMEKRKREEFKEMLSKPPVAVLTDEEKKEIADIYARTDALEAGVKKAVQRIEFSKRKWWLSIEEKYKLFGRSLHHDRDSGCIYERID